MSTIIRAHQFGDNKLVRSAGRYWRMFPGGVTLLLAAAGLHASSVPGVPNFQQVDEHVYRGAQPSAQGFVSLASLGIKTVIDLRGKNSEQFAVERAGLHYVRLPWSGYKAPDDTQIAAVLALLNDSSDWPVFVHCKRGADRTGTAIACYRIAHDHWSNQQALAEAKTFGMSSLETAMQRYILRFGAQGAPASASVLNSPDSRPSSPVPQPAP